MAGAEIKDAAVLLKPKLDRAAEIFDSMYAADRAAASRVLKKKVRDEQLNQAMALVGYVPREQRIAEEQTAKLAAASEAQTAKLVAASEAQADSLRDQVAALMRQLHRIGVSRIGDVDLAGLEIGPHSRVERHYDDPAIEITEPSRAASRMAPPGLVADEDIVAAFAPPEPKPAPGSRILRSRQRAEASTRRSAARAESTPPKKSGKGADWETLAAEMLARTSPAKGTAK